MNLACGEDALGVHGHVRVGRLDRGGGALDGHDARGRVDGRLLGHVERHEHRAAEHEHQEQREEEEACAQVPLCPRESRRSLAIAFTVMRMLLFCFGK